jgi:hypothetical protein
MGILSDGVETTSTLSTGECATLRKILKLVQTQPSWFEDFVQSLTIFADLDKPIEVDDLVKLALQSAHNAPTEKCFYGILAAQGEPGLVLDEGEFDVLRRYLSVHRDGFWLSGFIDCECQSFENGYRKSPEEIIEGLVGDELDQHELHVEVTRRMLRDFPAMFQAAAVHTPAQSEQANPSFQESLRSLDWAVSGRKPSSKPKATRTPAQRTRERATKV